MGCRVRGGQGVQKGAAQIKLGLAHPPDAQTTGETCRDVMDMPVLARTHTHAHARGQTRTHTDRDRERDTHAHMSIVEQRQRPVRIGRSGRRVRFRRHLGR